MPQVTTPGIRLPADLRQTLDAMAAAEGRSLGNLVRSLIRAELERRGVSPNPPAATREPALQQEVTK